MRLNPSHQEGYAQYYEDDDRQYNAIGQELDRTIRFAAILNQAEHTSSQATYNE